MNKFGVNILFVWYAWCFWQGAIGTTLRIAVPAVVMRTNRSRIRMSTMERVVGYGFIHLWRTPAEIFIPVAFAIRQIGKTRKWRNDVVSRIYPKALSLILGTRNG